MLDNEIVVRESTSLTERETRGFTSSMLLALSTDQKESPHTIEMYEITTLVRHRAPRANNEYRNCKTIRICTNVEVDGGS